VTCAFAGAVCKLDEAWDSSTYLHSVSLQRRIGPGNTLDRCGSLQELCLGDNSVSHFQHGLPSDIKPCLERLSASVSPFHYDQHRPSLHLLLRVGKPIPSTGTCPSYRRRHFAAVRTMPREPSVSQWLRASPANFTRSDSQVVPAPCHQQPQWCRRTKKTVACLTSSRHTTSSRNSRPVYLGAVHVVLNVNGH
jgi:hypothetical protein